MILFLLNIDYLNHLKEIKKSAAQIMIRWGLQRGHTVIPKSVSPTRIEENADVFDFNLNNEQMKMLDEL